MADAPTKAAVKTTLAVEQVEVPIGLYSTTSKPGELTKFDTAGPNGGKLKHEMRAVATPPDEQAEPPPKGDPLAAGDPGSLDPAKVEQWAEGMQRAATAADEMAEDAALVDGEFRQVLVEEGTGEVVEHDQIRRGVRQEDGSFIDCTDQLSAIEERTKLDEMRIVAFIDVGQVPRERVLASYYVGTDDAEALPVLRLLYDAMRTERRVAVARWTSRSRQSLGVVLPHRTADKQPCLLALKLAWAEDWRPAPTRAMLGSTEVPVTAVSQAQKLVRAMAGRRVALDDLRDDAVLLREELMARALAGEVDAEVVQPVTADAHTQDVGAALEASLAGLGGS